MPMNNNKNDQQVGKVLKRLSDEVTTMQSKLDRLNSIVTPLMSITDLSLAKKRVDQSRDFSEGSMLGDGVNINMLSQEERLRELELMDPQVILKNLADFCNTQDMPK